MPWGRHGLQKRTHARGSISTMRMFAISDLHTDFRENMLLVEQLSDGDYQQDVLIAAGDISDRLGILQATLARLRAKFMKVFYVPGNHELWVRRQPQTSVEKFFSVLALCQRLDIQTSPEKVGAAWVVPLFSWYESQFAGERDGDDPLLRGWADFSLCKWPTALARVCDWFLNM